MTLPGACRMRARLCLFLVLAVNAQTEAQEIRDYLIRLPPQPLLVPRTEASARFDTLLFGKSPDRWNGRNVSYAIRSFNFDTNLIPLAARFAPALHPTNFSVPRDFEEILTLAAKEIKGGFLISCDSIVPLHVDWWDVSSTIPTRSASTISIGAFSECPLHGDSIRTTQVQEWLDLHPVRTQAPANTRVLGSQYVRRNDSLTALLGKIGPLPEGSGRPPSGERTSAVPVVYFDFPGNSDDSWRTIYESLDSVLSRRTYVHPFVFEHKTAKGPARFELVLQYWFFYPFNDGANDHEGDWEHINVSVSTKARLNEQDDRQRLLDSVDLTRILGRHAPPDDLAISAVDYYFHHFVVTIDYKRISESLAAESEHPGALPIKRWLDPSAVYLRPGLSGVSCDSVIDTTMVIRRWGKDLRRSTEPYYDRAIQERFGYKIDSVFTTLPCGELLTIRFARRLHPRFLEWLHDWVEDPELVSHPVGYIAGNNKSLFELMERHGGNNNNSHGTYPFPGIWRWIAPASSEKVGGAKPSRERLEAGEFFLFDSTQIQVIPDWERVTVKLLTDPESQRKFAWLTLPLKWGYPVTESPGAELLKNYDFGQAAPDGPAFNLGWNSVGGGPGFERFDPSPVTLFLANSPIDYMDNRWGRWNIPTLAVTAVPPISALASMTGVLYTRYKKHEPAFSLYERGKEPARRISYGVALNPTDNAFASLLPPVGSLSLAGILSATLTKGPTHRDQDLGLRGTYSLYLGKNASAQSSMSYGSGRLDYRVRSPSAADVGGVSGKFSVLSLLGGLELRASGGFAPFLRGGGGWTWYHLRDDAAFAPAGGGAATSISAAGPKRFPLGFLPNTVTAGSGVEITLPASATARDVVRYRTQYGLRLGANYNHTKGAGGWWDFDIAGVLGSHIGIGLFPVGMAAATLAYIH